MTGAPAPTAAQTVGPFFGYALPSPGGPELVPPTHRDAVRVHGRVLAGDGAPVPDALLEIWQAAPDGSTVTEPGSLRRDGWTFTGWGRAATDDAGGYSFSTLVPGASAPGRAPFLALTVFARGLLDRLLTRIYLPDTDPAPESDPWLRTLQPERRATLVATRDSSGYLFDVVLQGERETVFLAHRPAPR